MNARVYVGTYEKYNNGSIAGAWLDLDKYATEEDFAEACAKLHADEEDPEFMMQDFEGFPKRYYWEGGLSSDLWEWLSLDDHDRELVEAYGDCISDTPTLEDAQDAYQGYFNSDIDFVQDLLEACGDIPRDLPSYICIDWEATARNIMFDYVSSRGFYFRCS